MTFTEKFVQVDGINYAIKIHGQGKPLFALHGFSEDSSTWDKLIVDGFQIFAIDLVGHGKTDHPDELAPYRLENLLTNLDTLFKTLSNNQPFVLLGYSMGGRLALRYALAYPESPIEQLILESTGAGISSPSERENRKKSDAQLAEKILENGSEWFADFWGGVSLFDSQKRLPHEIQQEIWTRRAKNTPHALAYTLLGTGQGELEYIGQKIDQLTPETLYISGALDLKYTQIAKALFAPCKKVSWVSVEEVGHNVHLEAPERYNKILSEHLAESICDIIKE